jgi:hypothetical protein
MSIRKKSRKRSRLSARASPALDDWTYSQFVCVECCLNARHCEDIEHVCVIEHVQRSTARAAQVGEENE